MICKTKKALYMKNKTIYLTLLASSIILSGCVSNKKIDEQKAISNQINELQQHSKTQEQSINQLHREIEQHSKTQEKSINRLHGEIEQVKAMTEAKIASDNATYSVKEGDYLAAIARDYRMPLDQLIKLNPQIKDKNILLIGEIINLK